MRLGRVRLSSLLAPEEKDVRKNRRPSYRDRTLDWVQLFSMRNNYRNYYTHRRMIFQCFSATIPKHLKEDGRYGLARLSAVVHIVVGSNRAVFAHLGADKNESLFGILP